MRQVSAVILALVLAACAAKHVQPIPATGVRSATATEVLDMVRSWSLPTGLDHLALEIDQHGEDIVFQKTSTSHQIWLSFCGPDELAHREAFQRFVETRAMDCSWYVGEKTVGCRAGYICRHGATTQDLAYIGASILAEVFQRTGEDLVRYRCY